MFELKVLSWMESAIDSIFNMILTACWFFAIFMSTVTNFIVSLLKNVITCMVFVCRNACYLGMNVWGFICPILSSFEEKLFNVDDFRQKDNFHPTPVLIHSSEVRCIGCRRSAMNTYSERSHPMDERSHSTGRTRFHACRYCPRGGFDSSQIIHYLCESCYDMADDGKVNSK